MPDLVDALVQRALTVRVVDVGAAWTGEEPYKALFERGVTQVVGFEPDRAACDVLRAKFPDHVFVPEFIGDGSRATFRESAAPLCSSIFEPNAPLIDHFGHLEGVAEVLSRTPVETRRLDDIPEVAGADLLKMDVQGAEAAVCRGAEKTLESVVVVHTEVNFIPIYEEQPLFAEVDQALRRAGFLFHKFFGLAGRAFQPMSFKDPVAPRGQLLWADAIYVRSFLDFAKLPAPSLLKLAAIVHACYGAADLAALALLHYDAKTGEDLWDPFVTGVTGKPKQRPPLPGA
jgi:FkbM family methyltransferase